MKGKGILEKKSNMHIPESEIRKANFTVLQNSSLVAPYMDEHMNIVRSENPGKPEAWITRHHIDNFAVWLRAKLMGDGTIAEQLQWLARGPSMTIMQYQGYEINGYTFYTRDQDEKSTNQNSSVRINAIGNDRNKDSYFEVIEKIWELEYGPLMFLCFGANG